MVQAYMSACGQLINVAESFGGTKGNHSHKACRTICNWDQDF